MKQINYTFDTLINNVQFISSEDLLKVMNSRQILEILSYNSDSITKINTLKFIKAVLENNSQRTKLTPELLIRIFDKGIDFSSINVKYIVNYSRTGQTNNKWNNFQIKKFNLLDFHFLENNELGELVMTIISLISEEKILAVESEGIYPLIKTSRK